MAVTEIPKTTSATLPFFSSSSLRMEEISEEYPPVYVCGLAGTHGSLHLIGPKPKINRAIAFRGLDERVLAELALSPDFYANEGASSISSSTLSMMEVFRGRDASSDRRRVSVPADPRQRTADGLHRQFDQ